MKTAWVFVVAVATVAVAHAAPVVQPVARYAPKGKPPGMTDHTTASPGALADLEYLYVEYFEDSGGYAAGGGGTVLQANPALGGADFHSLAEIAVLSDDSRQIVEIGWTVDRNVNGDAHPHLFSFHWIDGEPTCYNGCGWVQVSPSRAPGMQVTAGERHRYEIKLINGDWWLFYDGEGLGYYPQSRWNGQFATAGFVDWFGEVAASSKSPCTQMGNGKLGVDAGAASFEDLHLFDADGTLVVSAASLGTVTDPGLYDMGRTTPTSFGYGGPGACCTPSPCSAIPAACGQFVDPACPRHTLSCGQCGGGDMCNGDHQCVPRTDEPTGAQDSGGCCDTGASGTSPLLLGALVMLRIARRGAGARSARGSRRAAAM